MKKSIILTLVLLLALSGCARTQPETTTAPSTEPVTSAATTAPTTAPTTGGQGSLFYPHPARRPRPCGPDGPGGHVSDF